MATSSPAGAASFPTSHTLNLSFLQDPGQPPDPDVYYAGEGLLLTRNMYQGLLQYKADTPKRVLEPELATSWTISKDGLVYTFQLRHGVTFHDGTPFTSAAIAPDFARRTAVNGGPAYMVSDVASVQTPNPYEAVITLKTPNTAFLDYLASPYGPAMESPTALAANAGTDNDQTYLQTHDIGTGPYTLTEAKVGVMYQLKAYPAVLGPQAVLHDGQPARHRQPLDRGDRVQHGPDRRHPPRHDHIGHRPVQGEVDRGLLRPPHPRIRDGLREREQGVHDHREEPHGPARGDQRPRRSSPASSPAGPPWPSRPARTASFPSPTASRTSRTTRPSSRRSSRPCPASEKSFTVGYDTGAPDDQLLAEDIGAELQADGLSTKVVGYQTSEIYGWIGATSSTQGPSTPNVLIDYFWPDSYNTYTWTHISFDATGGLQYMNCDSVPNEAALDSQAVDHRIAHSVQQGDRERGEQRLLAEHR